MAEQARVDKGHSPTFIGDVMPQTAGYPVRPGDSWCDVSSLPYQLKIWNALTTSWVVLGLYPIGIPTPPPVITSPLTANATQNVYFSYQITATNSPFSWNATNLPAGLSVNTSTGVIYGTPTGSGVTNINLSATNMGGTGTAVLALTVAAPSVGIAGYAMIGRQTGNTTDKLMFSSETVSRLGATITTPPRWGGSGFASNTAGYNACGSVYPSGYAWYADVDKLQFSNDSIAATTSMLLQGGLTAQGLQSSVAGYAAGGELGPISTNIFTNIFRKLQFSGDVTSNLTSQLQGLESFGSNGVWSATSGYVSGGSWSYFGTATNRLSFSNDSVVLSNASLQGGLGQSACLSGDSNGYYCGGYPANSATCYRINYASDTLASISAASQAMGGCGLRSIPAGFVLGGYNSGTPVYKFPFTTEAFSLLGTSLPASNSYQSGFSNLN